MAGEHRPWQRYGETFWRAHHDAWKRSDLNQRQYCEAQGIPLKAFGNWRAKLRPSRSRPNGSCSIGGQARATVLSPQQRQDRPGADAKS